MTTTSNLFVTKLPRDITDTDLMTVCAEFKPVSATVMLDAATGKSKGFGFVLFPSAEAGQAALDKLNGKTVSSTRNFLLVLQPSKHNGRISCAESNALYVRNIPISTTRGEILAFLSQVGTLSHSVMRPDNYGSPVWVVYAEYDCIECAKQSLKLFHGNTSYFSPMLPILAKYADTNEIKEYRRKQRQEPVENNSNTPPRSESPVKEMVAGSPTTYRHNPYGACVLGTVCARNTRGTPERRNVPCPQAAPWIIVTA
jgi:RNA recognition motif-containing protein